MDEKGEASSAELLLSSIENQLEELDDDEFELPKISEPTLTSILNESVDEEETDPLAEENEFGKLLSSFDTESLGSFDDPERRRKRKIYEGHGSVMRHTVLKGISSQLVSAQMRINAGLPTAMAVDSLIAIGTAHGLVFVFEYSQAMKWSLGSADTGIQYGSVSSLSFNVDCSRILVGYAKGQITMWDLTNGKLLRTITDAHPQGQAVLHVRFTDNPKVALMSDSGGSVFDMEFTRGMSGRGCISRCLFSGSRGEVCSIEPLHQPHFARNQSSTETMLVAMVTFTKVLVINLRPEVKIIFSFLLPGQQDCLPLLSWRYAGIKVPGKDSLFDPVLAIARQSTMHFFQAVIRDKDIQFQKLQTSELQYKLVAFCWLSSQTLVTMDTFEKLHLVDVRSWEELEVIDLSDMQFVYSTSYFKGLATGGNVSPALSYAGDYACYHSIFSYRSQLFILGNKSVHVMTTRTWQERLDVLLRENRHQDAIALALSFYDGSAKAVIGLPSSEDKRMNIVADKMLDILYTYIDLSMTKLCPDAGRIDELIKHYENVVPICVEYCLRLERVDVLFSRLYERFSEDIIAHGVFLECLEPYILDDQLKNVSPQIIKDLTYHFQGKDMLPRVEACIVHLDIISLDIHETVKLCWDNAMYDGIIYIYNQGLQDYVTPLLELITVLREAIKSGKQLAEIHVTLGNKLLVYISNSLAGLAYPIGSLKGDQVELVKSTIFKTLTCLHSIKAEPTEKPYPYVRTFLDFDTREFLNVLALAFEEHEFASTEGVQQRQRVVDILLSIMVEGIDYTPKQRGMLYTFLARQMARHSHSIQLNRMLFEKVLEFLCKPGDDSQREERQEALLEILNVEKELQLDVDKLLVMAEHANLFRVCEYIYKKHKLHDKILLTYVNDPSRCHQAFTFIEQTLADGLSRDIQQRIINVTLDNITALTACDATQTSHLLTEVMKADILQVVSSLETEPLTQYELLKSLLDESDSDDTGTQPALHVTLYDIYIERMCVYNNTDVEYYLKTHNRYRSDSAYQICQKHRQYDSMSYLLEKMGRIQQAFNMMLKTFKEKIELFLEQIADPRASKNVNNITTLRQQLEGLLLKMIGLCQRNSAKLSESERESLWFPLLESVMEPQQKLDTGNEHSVIFKDASRQVMNCMMGYIALPSLMSKIIEEFTFSEGRFGDVKDLVLGMLHTYNYEKTLMSTVSNMVNRDLVCRLADKKNVCNRALIPRNDKCSYCNRHVLSTMSKPQLRLFRCGHLFHESCLERTGTFSDTEEGRVFTCYICNQTQYSSKTPTSPLYLQKGISSHNLNVRKDSTSQDTEDSFAQRHRSSSGIERGLIARRHRNNAASELTLRLKPPSCIDNDLLDDT